MRATFLPRASYALIIFFRETPKSPKNRVVPNESRVSSLYQLDSIMSIVLCALDLEHRQEAPRLLPKLDQRPTSSGTERLGLWWIGR
jgi:hypothetical protein